MLKTRIPSSIKLAALGAIAFAAQVGCSDDPQPPQTMFPTTGGTTSTTGGTPGASGTFGTAGTTPGASGTGFGTAGTPSTGGGGAGGTGSTSAGTGGTSAGTGGTGGSGVVIPQEPFCKGKAAEALPYEVTSGFKQSGWSAGAQTQFKAGAEITPNPPPNCTERVEGAKGDCSVWRFTPDMTTPSIAWVEWVLQWDPGYTHPPVCIAEGATHLVFHAKGTKGGEKVFFGAPGVAEDTEMTLTTEWKRYEIALNGQYNGFNSGVTKGFAIKVEPGMPAEVVEFYVDNILVVKDLPPDGGEGGAGSGGAAN